MRVLELEDIHSEAAVITEPPHEAAAGVEELAAQLWHPRRRGQGVAGWQLTRRRRRPVPRRTGEWSCLTCGLWLQVCGLEGGVIVSCGGTNGISGAAAVFWAFGYSCRTCSSSGR